MKKGCNIKYLKTQPIFQKWRTFAEFSTLTCSCFPNTNRLWFHHSLWHSCGAVRQRWLCLLFAVASAEWERWEKRDSYLSEREAFCWQSASKDLFPCPLSPCQIVIKPSWKSKKAFTFGSTSTPSLAHSKQHRPTYAFDLERPKCGPLGGSPKTYHKLKFNQPPLQYLSSRCYTLREW